MAITVSHQPDMNMLYSAGYSAGAGQFRRFQMELAQRERMQARALETNLLSQEIANQNSLQRMVFANQLQGQQNAMLQQAGFQNQLALQDANNQARKQLQQMRQADRQDELEFRQRHQLMRDSMQHSNALEADMNEFAFNFAFDRMDSIQQSLADGYVFASDEDQRKYAALNEEINRVLADDTMTPTAKSQAAMKLTQKLPIPKVKTPDIETVIEESVYTKNYDRGDGTVAQVVFGLDRDNKPRWLGEIDPPDNQQVDYMQLRAHALKELQAEKKATSLDAPDQPITEKEITERVKLLRQQLEGGEGEPEQPPEVKPRKTSETPPKSGKVHYDPASGGYYKP